MSKTATFFVTLLGAFSEVGVDKSRGGQSWPCSSGRTMRAQSKLASSRCLNRPLNRDLYRVGHINCQPVAL
jgi:hypothetical protein